MPLERAFVFLIGISLVYAQKKLTNATDDLWEDYKVRYGKKYSGEEDANRRVIWEENVKKIRKHNSGNHSFTLASNHLTDFTEKEYQNLLSYQPLKPINDTYQELAYDDILPSYVNWTAKGYVTPVKNQGLCSSCWAFSATGSLEGQHFKKTGKLVSLSEQNLVDCSSGFGNDGCKGGLTEYAFNYIINNSGIDTEASYPYIGRDGQCHYNSSYIGATCQGYNRTKSGDEKQLEIAVATIGPISVSIDASSFAFQNYHSGVYDHPGCSTTNLDHGVLVVGYGTTFRGVDYWLVKNSWGKDWGEKGYFKMARNNDNQCGIATRTIFPLVANKTNHTTTTSNATTSNSSANVPLTCFCVLYLLVAVFALDAGSERD